MINKPPINVQDGFFYQLRKDNTPVDVVLLSERTRLGRIKRFDKYALVLDVEGREEMIYKHAIASVSPAVVVRPAVAAPAPVPAPVP
jgi:host factor-I protein